MFAVFSFMAGAPAPSKGPSLEEIATAKTIAPLDQRIQLAHSKCTSSSSCYFFEVLPAEHPRQIILDYLDSPTFKALSRRCRIIGAPILSRLENGWAANECTQQAVQTLTIKKVVGLLEDAEIRKAVDKTSSRMLNAGFWLTSDYFAALQAAAPLMSKKLASLKNNQSFFHGHPPMGFTHVDDAESASGKRVLGYQIAPGIEPTQALGYARAMLCFINHQEFIQIAYYQVLLDIMGEVRFNIYFDAKGKKPLRLDPFFNQTPLKDFFLFETVSDIGTLGNRPVQLGSHVRLQNLPIYSVKHGIGAETQEIDAVCVALKPVQKFCTFGSSPKGQTEEQILEMLAVAHNLPPLNMAERLPAPLLEALNIKKDQLTHPDNISDVEAQPMRQKAVDYVVTKEDLINIHSTHPHLAGFSATIGRANLPALMALLKK